MKEVENNQGQALICFTTRMYERDSGVGCLDLSTQRFHIASRTESKVNVYNCIMEGKLFPQKKKGVKYSRNDVADCCAPLGMLNTRKGICGGLLVGAQ